MSLQQRLISYLADQEQKSHSKNNESFLARDAAERRALHTINGWDNHDLLFYIDLMNENPELGVKK